MLAEEFLLANSPVPDNELAKFVFGLYCASKKDVSQHDMFLKSSYPSVRSSAVGRIARQKGKYCAPMLVDRLRVENDTSVTRTILTWLDTLLKIPGHHNKLRNMNNALLANHYSGLISDMLNLRPSNIAATSKTIEAQPMTLRKAWKSMEGSKDKESLPRRTVLGNILMNIDKDSLGTVTGDIHLRPINDSNRYNFYIEFQDANDIKVLKTVTPILVGGFLAFEVQDNIIWVTMIYEAVDEGPVKLSGVAANSEVDALLEIVGRSIHQ